MSERSQEPTGFTRRSRRLSDAETEQRMLAVAVARVHREGLTVSLDHIRFEDLIRDADVSRSAAYRRWPYKDLFFSDLVKELAQDSTPAIAGEEVDLMRRILAEHPDGLDSASQRESLLLELFRQLTLLDFETMYQSPGWRTYLALHATVMSLSEGDLRDQVREALARSEQSRTTRVAQSWAQLSELFGYRLRPELGSTFEAMATLLSALLHGLIIMALPSPEIATHRALGRPPGAAAASEWSLAALGLASIAATYLEPDPDVRWDGDRAAQVRAALGVWGPPGITQE